MSRIDVDQWLEDNLDVHQETIGRNRCREWILKECLFCGRPQKMYVNVDNGGKFICYAATCGAAGGLLALIQAVEDCDPFRARTILAGLSKGITQAKPLSEVQQALKSLRERKQQPQAEVAVSVELPEEFQPCWDGASWRVPEYLVGEKRRLKRSTIKKWGIGYCAAGRYYGRCVVPVTCAGMTSFVARDMTGQAKQKYLNPSANQSFLLFAYDRLVPELPIIAVEGVFDAIRLWTYGHQAVAYFGSTLRPPQVSLLARLKPRELILLPDPGAELPVLEDAMSWRSRFPRVLFARLKEGDADSAPRKVVENALALAEPLSSTSQLLQSEIFSLRDIW